MADFSTAATQALNALNNGPKPKRYRVDQLGREVEHGSPMEQVEAAIRLNALAARCTGGLFRVGKFRNPRP